MPEHNFLNGNKYRLSGCYIELTSECNLRCKHCYNDSGILRSIIDKKTFKNVLNCYDSDVDPFFSLSGGEPLLHPDIWNIIDMAIESGVTNILLISNATLITRDVALELKKRDISVQVSINSTNPKIHEIMCGTGTLKRTLNGLQNLLDVGVKKVLVRYTLTQANKDDFINTMRELSGKGLFNILLGSLIDVGRAEKNNELSLKPQELSQILEKIKKDVEFIELKEKYFPNFEMPSVYTGGCPIVLPNQQEDKWVEINPRIDAFGKVYICQGFNDEMYSIGNINENRLDQIINSENLVKLINFLYSGLFYGKECKMCVWKDVCGKGCVAERIQKGGSIQYSDGDCSIRKIDLAKQLINFTSHS